MADYTYGGGDRVVLDPVDRSRNAPSVLAGYPLDVRPLSGWPGLGSGPAAGGN